MDTPSPAFAIVMTTYRRPELARKAVQSVLGQTHHSWQFIIVNDSPDVPYTELLEQIKDQPQIVYIHNVRNVGKNASVNTALELLRHDSFDGYVLFLDDDDWLEASCLQDFTDAIHQNPQMRWFVSERVTTDGSVLTRNATGRTHIRYYQDCLLTKRFSGDATHCVHSSLLEHATFPTRIANAEEWIFFSKLAQYSPAFFFTPQPGTRTTGYLPDGLTARRMTLTEKLKRYGEVCCELQGQKLWSPYTTLYMVLRLGKIFI